MLHEFNKEVSLLTWLIITQCLLFFSLFLLLATNMVLTSLLLLTISLYFIMVVFDLIRPSDGIFLFLLVIFSFALSYDVTITVVLAFKLILIHPLVFYCHYKLVKIMNS